MTVQIFRLASVVLMGTAFALAPMSLSDRIEAGYASAQADKGGNGNGGGGGGGQSNGGGGGGQSNAGGGGAAHANVKSNFTTQKSVSRAASASSRVQLAKAKAPSEAPRLGRWNAAKPIDHPAIQAHLKNGNFKGTIGMVAAYLKAQLAVDDLQDNADFEEDMIRAKEILAAQAAYEDDDTLTPPSESDLEWATTFLAEAEGALADLAAAEANMEKYSNRDDWASIRTLVREKMGLEGDENDLTPAT